MLSNTLRLGRLLKRGCVPAVFGYSVAVLSEGESALLLCVAGLDPNLRRSGLRGKSVVDVNANRRPDRRSQRY